MSSPPNNPKPGPSGSWFTALLAWQSAGAAAGLAFGAWLLVRSPVPGAELRSAAVFLGAGSLLFMGSAVLFGVAIRAVGIARPSFCDFAFHAKLAWIGVCALLGHMLARESDVGRGLEWLCAFLGMVFGAAIGAWAATSRAAKPAGAVVTAIGAFAIVGMAVVSQLSRTVPAESRPSAGAPTALRPAGDATTPRIRLLVMDDAGGEPSNGIPSDWRLPNFDRVRAEGALGNGRDDRPIADDTPWVSLLTGKPPSRHGARGGAVLRSTLAPAALRVRSRPIRDWLEILRVARAEPAETRKLGCRTITDIAAEAGRRVVMSPWISESESAPAEKPDLWVFLGGLGGRFAIERWLEAQRPGLEPGDVLAFAVVARSASLLEPAPRVGAPLVELGLLGSGIRRADLASPTIYDVAPTLLHILGIPAGRDMPGRVLTEALTDSRPARRISSWESPPVAH